jgi:hypothetical protein
MRSDRPGAGSVKRFALGVCFLLATGLSIAEDSAAIKQLKVAYLYNFTQYITWPSNAFDSPDAPFLICVFGRDVFGEALEPVSKRRAQGRQIKLKYPRTLEEVRGCQVVFVESRSPNLLRELKDAPVLTVTNEGDSPHDAVLTFVLNDDHLRWILNLSAARKAHLQVSSKLIEIALTVIGDTR